MKYTLYKVTSNDVQKIYEVEDKKNSCFRLLIGILTLDEVKKKIIGDDYQNFKIEYSGIESISRNDEGLTSSANKNPDGVVYHNDSQTLGTYDPIEDKTGFVRIQNLQTNEIITTDYKLLLRGYEPGFVICNNKLQSNFLGMCGNGYIVSIGKRNVRTTVGPRGAKVFKLKSLEKFINDHRHSLEYFVKSEGWQFSIEFADKTFEKIFNENAKTKDFNLLNKLKEEFDHLNTVETQEEIIEKENQLKNIQKQLH